LLEPPDPDEDELSVDDAARQFSIVYQMLTDQLAGIEKVDTKLASLIAASAAAMYFFFEKAHTTLDMAIAAAFAIPLVLGLIGYRTFAWYTVGPAGFVKYYANAPKETLIATTQDMVTCYDRNSRPLDQKGVQLDRVLLWAGILSILAILIKLIEAHYGGAKIA